MTDQSELDVMFFWNDEGYLALRLELSNGEVIEYDFEQDETDVLYEFLRKKSHEANSLVERVLKLFIN